MQNLKIRTVILLFIISPSCWALDSDRTAKIVIQGPGCKTQLKENQTECLKGLTIEQGSLLIKSTYGLIKHQDKGIDSVLMKGQQVYMEQLMEDRKKMTIKANQIDYQKNAEKVFLKGDVKITSSIGVTTGENLEFNLKTQEIISVGEEEQPFKMEIDQNND